MTILLEVDSIPYDNFVSASCEIRLDALSNTFSFDAVAANFDPLPFKGGEACKVIVEGETVLTGTIEVVSVSGDASNTTITFQGRDKTADLLDSTLDSISDLTGPITLKEVIEKVIDQLKIDISVIDLVNPETFTGTEDVISPEIGDNAFSFLEKYSRKRQVLLTSNGDGNIVIDVNSGESAAGSIQNIKGSEDNNVIAYSFSFDTTGRFNLYKFGSQFNPSALSSAGSTSNASVVNQNGSTFDPEIRIGRQLVLVSEATLSSTHALARAKWEANIRKARGLQYAVTVNGYKVDLKDSLSDLWRVNRLYDIQDDNLGKREPMLCNSVTYSLDLSAGQITSLGFVDEKTYTLDLTNSKTSTTADNFL